MLLALGLAVGLGLQSVPVSADNCLYCTVAVTLVEEIALLQQLSGTKAFELVCAAVAQGSTLPVAKVCDAFAIKAGPVITAAVANGESPDDVCLKLGYCDGTCTLFRQWPPTQLAEAAKAQLPMSESVLLPLEQAAPLSAWAPLVSFGTAQPEGFIQRLVQFLEQVWTIHHHHSLLIILITL